MRDQDRLTQLEIKASFLEDQVEQLDAVVARQQQQIDLLARELQRLREQQPEAAPLNERPPHY
ncbi:MAG: SlyX family protein [Inhella sp.]|jgi:SlyX protein|nr:SlyX family protein [Inhella sp.]